MRGKVWRSALLLLFWGALSVPLYVFLHELGHSLVALAVGARIVEFSVLTAHMTCVGGRFTPAASLWLHANGLVFPLVLGLLWALRCRPGRGKPAGVLFTFFFTLTPVLSLLSWVVIPLLSLSGQAPEGDDCTLFLAELPESCSPLAVSAAAAGLCLLSGCLLFLKKIPQNLLRVLTGNVGTGGDDSI